MRILIFTDEYDCSYFTFIYNEIKNLEASGNEVLVVCERIGKLKKTDTNYICIPQIQKGLLLNVYLSAYKRNLYFILSKYRYIRKRKKIIEDFKPDLIHAHFGDTAVRLYFPLKNAIQKIPFVVSFHGFDASQLLNDPKYVSRLKSLSGAPDFFAIYVSMHLGNNLIRSGINLNKKNSFLLYYGIDVSIFNRNYRPKNNVKVFLQISSFFEKKGHTYSLQAFGKLIAKHPGKAKLIIGGDGSLRETLEKERDELGLTNDVEFFGWVSREDATELLNKADYFIHHSITGKNGDQEGLPNAIIEAMAMQLPVLSTYHSGIPELIENGVNGYLVNEKDVDTYAKRMEDILVWEHLPANHQKVVEKFSFQSHNKGLLNIYTAILEGGSRT